MITNQSILLIGAQPCTVVRKDFMLSPGELECEVTLDKQVYQHGEKIAINLCIRNHSNKTVKKIKAMVQQGVDVVLFQNGQYRNTIACMETSEGNLKMINYIYSVINWSFSSIRMSTSTRIFTSKGHLFNSRIEFC